MFKSIDIMDNHNYFNPSTGFGYYLCDDDFEDTVYFNGERSSYLGAILLAYSKRNLPVVPNLALAVRWMIKRFTRAQIISHMPIYLNTIDAAYPQYQYSTKIHPCVMRHVKMLDFSEKRKK